jgi:hypothetical protein
MYLRGRVRMIVSASMNFNGELSVLIIEYMYPLVAASLVVALFFVWLAGDNDIDDNDDGRS